MDTLVFWSLRGRGGVEILYNTHVRLTVAAGGPTGNVLDDAAWPCDGTPSLAALAATRCHTKVKSSMRWLWPVVGQTLSPHALVWCALEYSFWSSTVVKNDSHSSGHFTRRLQRSISSRCQPVIRKGRTSVLFDVASA